MPKKSKGKKGNAASKLTPNEKLLEYKIKLAQEKLDIEEAKLQALKEESNIKESKKNMAQIERDQYLEMCIHKFKNSRVNEEEITSDEVDIVLKDLYRLIKDQENETSKILAEIQKTDDEIEKVTKECDYWQDFKDSKRHEMELKTELLKQEMIEMKENFSVMTKFVEDKYEKDKLKAIELTESQIEITKADAFNKAIGVLDKSTIEEVRNHAWLKEELDIHEKRYEELLDDINDLEQRNLKKISHIQDANTKKLELCNELYKRPDLPDEVDSIIAEDLQSFFDDKSVDANASESKYSNVLLTLCEEKDDEEFVNMNDIEHKMLTLKGVKMPILSKIVSSKAENDYRMAVNPSLEEYLKSRELYEIQTNE